VELALLVLRVVVGALFVGHGAQKLFGVFGGHGLAGTAGFFESIGLRPGRLHAPAAGVAELGGGALIALGLFTPLGAMLIIAVMVAAVATGTVAVLAGGERVFVGSPRTLFADPVRARSWRLELPPLLRVQEELRARGLDLGREPLTPETAMERLCRL